MNRKERRAQEVKAQQQLANNVALNVGYFRTWFGQQRFTVNRTVGTVGVDEFCYTTPNDSRLGVMSNKQLCGLYDAKRRSEEHTSELQSH